MCSSAATSGTYDRRFPAEAAPPRWAMLLAVGVVVVALALFVLIAEDVLDGGGLISRDEAVLQWFVDHRSDALVGAARVVGVLASFVPLAVASLVVGFFLWRRRWSIVLAAAPIVSLSIAGLASTIAKATFDRPRPPIEFRAVDVTLAAFPSGHAADAAAFFLATACVFAITVSHRRLVHVAEIVCGISCALVVGVSRLVLGVHWLSDVVAGWSLGTAAAVTVVTASWVWTARARTSRRAAT